MKLVLLGPPGAGKGTVAESITNDELAYLSTGNMFRERMQVEDDFGKEIKQKIDAGILMPDEVVTKMVLEKIENTASFLLDGYPRTIPQAESLGDNVDKVILIDVPDESLVKRLSSRRTCPKCKRVYNLVSNPPKEEGKCDDDQETLILREDDKEETVRDRLGVYQKQTAPLVDFYEKKGLLIKVNGDQPIPDVIEAVKQAIAQ
tara:strand:- start:1734 stop:2345 length:612 start_codon:yes stop_codon:yes gene_type:complete